jgi:hypothetical protein
VRECWRHGRSSGTACAVQGQIQHERSVGSDVTDAEGIGYRRLSGHGYRLTPLSIAAATAVSAISRLVVSARRSFFLICFWRIWFRFSLAARACCASPVGDSSEICWEGTARCSSAKVTAAAGSPVYASWLYAAGAGSSAPGSIVSETGGEASGCSPVPTRDVTPPYGCTLRRTTSSVLCERNLFEYSVRHRSAGVGAGSGAGGSDAGISSAKKIESFDVPICERKRVRASRRSASATCA